MAKKTSRGLVALSASAVATIYVAGLLSTRSATESVIAASAAASMASPTAATAAGSASAPTVVVGASATSTSTQAATAAAYKDGIYSGTGTSRVGNVSVSVTTSGGAISNVQITKVTTSYPVSRIASLPSQVVQKQAATVNLISGATYSSQAFRQAVQQALALAQAANQTSATA